MILPAAGAIVVWINPELGALAFALAWVGCMLAEQRLNEAGVAVLARTDRVLDKAEKVDDQLAAIRALVQEYGPDAPELVQHIRRALDG